VGDGDFHPTHQGSNPIETLARCDKAQRVGDPWDRLSTPVEVGTSRPLLSHKLLVYLAYRLLDILLGL
jgi:hypothetical protein